MSETPTPLSQQERLRAVGLYLDRQNWRNVRIIWQPGGVLVQGTPIVRGEIAPHYETAWLTDAQLETLAAEARGRRGRG